MTKVMLITGGSRGIGAATARLAAARGYDVALSYAERREAADAVVADVVKVGRWALAVKADLGEPAEVARLFDAVHAEFGRLDAFFNNAGILIGPPARFLDIPLERLQRVLAVNAVGAFLAAQAAARRMSTRNGGRGGAIVNMSSIAAKMGGAGEATDYGLSKGGIDSLTIGMAKELAAEGIRVNAVRPGLIRTDIHAEMGAPDRIERLQALVPMQRGGTPEEVAEAVLWLCSEQSSYCTGVLLEITGGRGI